MATWKCTACGRVFDDFGGTPVCTCQAAGTRLVPAENRGRKRRGASEMVPVVPGNREILPQEPGPVATPVQADAELEGLYRRVTDHVARNADKSTYLKGLTDKLEEEYQAAVRSIRQQHDADTEMIRQACLVSIQAEESKALAEIEAERARLLDRRNERTREKKNIAKMLLSRLRQMSKLSWFAGLTVYVLMVIFMVTLIRNDALQVNLVSSGGKVDLVDTLLMLFIILPVLSLFIAIVVECFVRFEMWFYGIDRRNRRISERKFTSIGRSYEEGNAYLADQEAIVRNHVRGDSNVMNLPCVDAFMNRYAEITSEADEKQAVLDEQTEKQIAGKKQNLEKQKNKVKDDWINETTQAARSCAEYFEYRYRDLGVNRGPAFWLVFRFCGRDGVIAQAPWGSSQTHTEVHIRVSVSETQLYVKITDIDGKELLYDSDNQRYQFSRVNQADLTEPAERYGYANALMLCTVFEAKKILEQAGYGYGYDITFELRFKGADVDGFEIIYDGSIEDQ
ncbi:MAG: hypothetical protein IJ088_04100 [Clostridia bacterium]|nr:hypothetical protein [Clostridia bacterium]